MASRKITDLHPELQPRVIKFLQRCNDVGFDVLITCTYRSWIEQEKLYGWGRTLGGRKKTDHRPGHSPHNHMENGKPASLAFDIIPLKDGKPITYHKDPVWLFFAEIAKEYGIEWMGDHAKYPEINHFEFYL